MRNRNSITEGELFALLSRMSNSLPEDTVRDVYYGLVRLIVAEFRAGREVFLPGFGRFSLIVNKGRKRFVFKTGEIEEYDLRKITFSGAKELKKYINSMVIKD